jgi:hypothetical protein
MTITRRALMLGVACSGLGSLRAVNARAEDLPAGRRVALRGYDPIAYFDDGQPAPGSREFWYVFDDVVYLFRSAQRRDRFAADPERFAPQYDGYCAGGVSKGYKTEPDPEAWIIANGKLFVFEFKERIPMFRPIIDDVAAKANENWRSLRNK